MRANIFRSTLLLTAGLLAAARLTGQDRTDTPRVENARIVSKVLVGPLAAEIKPWAGSSDQPRWLGYAVPQIAGDRLVCCGNYGDSWQNGNGECGTCRLEDRHTGDNMMRDASKLELEGSRELLVLFRASGKQVTKIRVASKECTLDAGGLPFVWLTGVQAAESVELLAGYVRALELEDHDGRSMGNGALTAIAMHAGEAADRALESFVKTDQRESLRKQAAFWLGESRGKTGLVSLQKMAKSDPSPDVRAQVTFALSINREPGALDEMIRMARDDESSHVRGQALFWLAHKAGEKAVGTITGAIDNDPDTDVKKKAVFALSQLPKDEGVPKLIEVAQSNRNLAVRKQAIFWLGQSNDPRALAFFEKVLTQ